MNQSLEQSFSAQSSAGQERWRAALCYLLLAVVPALLYWPTLAYPLLGWDDLLHITSNPALAEPGLQSVGGFFVRPMCDTYMPLTFTFWSAETWLGRWVDPSQAFNPVVFHAGCVLLHVLCVLALFKVLELLLADRRGACVGALLLAVHPLAVESVAWVSETKGLLATVLSLLAMWQYLRATTLVWRTESATEYIAIWRPGRYALATLLFVAALGCKPAAVVTPLLLLAIDGLWLGRTWRGALARLGPWLAPALVVAVVMPQLQPAAQLSTATSWAVRPIIASDAIAFYFWKLLAPVGLCFDHGRTPGYVLSHGWVYITWLVPWAVVPLCFGPERRRVALTGMALLTAGLLPVLGLVPFYYQENSTVADRYMYLPLIGPALVVGYLLARFRHLAVLGAACCLLLVCAVLSHRQERAWESDEALNQHCLAINPRSATAHGNLAATLANRGQYDAAIEEFRQAETLNPRKRGPWIGHIIAALHLGQPDEAVRLCQATLAIDDRQAEPHYLWGGLLMEQQDVSGAIEHFAQACRLNPRYADAEYWWGLALLSQSQGQAALEHIERAVELNPRNAPARFELVDLLIETDRAPEALAHCQELVAQSPAHATAHRKLARVLELEGQIEAAEEHLDQAALLESAAADTRLR